MKKTDNHPVWCVYNTLRTARLNYKYYSFKLRKAEFKLFWMDFLLTITVPSSAVAGLFFWENPVGIKVWKSLCVISAFIAIIKPMSGILKKRNAYQELKSGYKTIDFDLYAITNKINHEKAYSKQLQSEYQQVTDRMRSLVIKDPDSQEDKLLIEKFEKEVNTELPPSSFYIPEEE
jgi:hypothetical protein